MAELSSLDALISWGGYIILFLIIFSETGLFFGFLLPGDALIITAGLMAAKGTVDITIINIVMISAAIAGDSTGYYIGERFGARLFEKEDSTFFKRQHLLSAQQFYEKHGGKMIFFARFIPLVRSFATTVAGIAKMSYPKFMLYSISGAVTWILSLTLLGYMFGLQFPELVKYLNAVILLGVLIIIFNIIYQLVRAKISKRSS
jgi:membrane-associated protein